MKLLIFKTVMPVFFLLTTLSVAGQESLWRVGVARVDITPTDSLWLAGYAARDHAAEGALHQIWAKALAVQDASGHRGVLITADVLGFPKKTSDAIRTRCQQKYRLKRSQIILSGSHTHTGPVLEDALYDIYPLDETRIKRIEKYTRQLQEKIVALVGEALNDMPPAQLFAANGVVRFQVNRRNNNASTLSIQSDLNGPNDYAVPVLSARRKTGELMTVLFGYACHPTVLNGYEWSGDYPGFAQIDLEEKYPGAQAMFFQGCGADQNPLPRRTVGLARQYGMELSAAVQNVVEGEAAPLAAELQTAYTEIDLAMSEPPSEGALVRLAEGEDGYRRRWARRMLQKVRSGETLPTSYPYPVQVWRLGDQAVFVLGGEVVVDYAIRLKQIFGEDVFVMAYANDVMAYIPTARVLREGGYEGVASQIVYGLPAAWQADIESRIIQTAIQLAKEAGVKLPQVKLPVR